MNNLERDKAWEAFIKRKDVKQYFKDPQFKFPLQKGFYEMWCQSSEKASEAASKYEELRRVIDDGDDTLTHEMAVGKVHFLLAKTRYVTDEMINAMEIIKKLKAEMKEKK